MKQMIVMISMVVLGLFIGGIVMGFEDDVKGLGSATETSLGTLKNQISISAPAG